MPHVPPSYEPSPEEIAAACAEIRRSWSAREHYCRRIAMAGATHFARSQALPRHWQPPMIHVEVDVAAAVGA